MNEDSLDETTARGLLNSIAKAWLDESVWSQALGLPQKVRLTGELMFFRNGRGMEFPKFFMESEFIRWGMNRFNDGYISEDEKAPTIWEAKRYNDACLEQ